MKWFAIRVTYGREKKFCKALEDEGFTTFVPPVSNLCFVRSEKADLDSYMISLGENCPARYIWDRSTGGPIVVPDKAMDDFIHITRIMADDALYLNELGPKLREGQKVRVKSGPLAGVEGRVARIKRSRRVVVELPGLLAVATTYVKPSDIEVL